MSANTKAFSGFAVDDVVKAGESYGETLGVETEMLDEENGSPASTSPAAGTRPYQKPDFEPATYTHRSFQVEDVDKAVDDLTSRGVNFEQNDYFDEDEKGIGRGMVTGTAWFKDPAGNILSVLQDQ